MKVSEWKEKEKLVWRKFPGPRATDVPLRVAIEREAYGELIAHAKESLKLEVCGVLVGATCEDEEGVFVHVQAVIRGTAAREASAHVTFTQETWTVIHNTLEKKYPKLRIVGWYHTHPGFGVEFSDMDLFIHQNFFPGQAQIAFVTDPLGGDVAICINSENGPTYLKKFWVDAREHAGREPRSVTAAKVAAEGAPAGSTAALEARLSQVLQAVEDQRVLFNRFVMTVLILVCLSLITFLGYNFYMSYTHRLEPPKPIQFAQVPVVIDGKPVLLGIALVSWQVPPELNALMLQEDMLRRAMEQKAAGSTNAAVSTNVQPKEAQP